MSWYVYLLLCDQKTYYVGITNDLVNRFAQHLDKQSFHTSKFTDLKLIYVEAYPDKYLEASRERQLKGWSHTKKQKFVESNIDSHRCTEYVEVLLRKDEKLVSLIRE